MFNFMKKIRFLTFTLLLASIFFLPTKIATAQLKATLEGHTDLVWSVAFSPNGQTLASGSQDRTIRLWNPNNGNLKRTLRGHRDAVNSVAFSPDGRTLASGSWDGTVRLWNPNNGNLKRTLTGHTDGISFVAFSPDGQTLASASGDQTIRLWNPNTGKLKRTLIGHTGRVASIAFSPDGRTLASASGDQTIRLWNPNNGNLKRTLTGHTGDFSRIMFSPNGLVLANGNQDGTIHLWNPNTGKLIRTLAHRTGGLKPVVFSSDSTALFIGGRGISIWDMQVGEYKKPFVRDITEFLSLVFSPDGQMVASGSADNKVRLWEYNASDYEFPTITRNPMVRLIHFIPNDQSVQPERVSALRKLIKEAQAFYADEMERHGYGRKTFTLEVNNRGEPVIHQIKGKFKEDHYYQTSSFWKVWAELPEHFNNFQHAYLVALDLSYEDLDDGTAAGIAGHIFIPRDGSRELAVRGPEIITQGDELIGGLAIIPSHGHNFERLGLTIHELSHSFGLEHDFREGRNSDLVSECAAEWLSVSRFFNNSNPISRNAPGQIQLTAKPSFSFKDNGIRIRFRVTDADGLHQAQLIVPEILNGDRILGPYHLLECKSLNGRTATVEFISEALTITPVDRITLQIIDVKGSITWATFLTDIASVLPRPKTISIPDKNLAAAIRTGLGLDPRANITDRAMLKLTRLDARDRQITDLTGLEHATQLTSLVLYYNQIRDINPISGLTQLTDLRLDGNQISNLNPLTELTQLELLYIGGNKINNSGVRLLANLTKLKWLALWGNQISDITPLSSLTKLESLWIGDNKIRDVSPLAGMMNLTTLHIKGNPIEATSPLSSLTNLTDVDIEISKPTPVVQVGQAQRPPDPIASVDVNRDGVVNILDLVSVSSNFGQTGENIADVNGDGIVNIVDLVKVAGEMGAGAAAPAAHPQTLQTLSAADVKDWLSQAQHADLTDATSQRGILMLQQLLTVLIPKETSLLPNYPNPFNPETWIPYQLAKSADVTLSIYAVDGRLIRTLTLGHQPAGMYHTKNRAVYWDGKNQVGEPVASGVYFYTLTAGNFTATRKMLIRK